MTAPIDTGSGPPGIEAWPWDDELWMRGRGKRHGGDLPLSFYRLEAEGWYASRFALPVDWSRFGQELIPYVADLGFTHVTLDAALSEAPELRVCEFVDACHVAGIGVVVAVPSVTEGKITDDGATAPDVAAPAGRDLPDEVTRTWLDWCRRCHIDGLETARAEEKGDDCWLFVDDSAATVRLAFRPRWRQALTAYLSQPPAERSRLHRAWIRALTPLESGRGVIDQAPPPGAATNVWRAHVHGDDWQRFAALRAALGLMWALPGDKWLAMGVEFGQILAPAFKEAMHWPLLFETRHAGVLREVADLNRLYVNEPALQIRDDERHGFQWLIEDDSDNSVVVFARLTASGYAGLICISNFQACVHHGYRLGAPAVGRWREVFNSDSVFYGGSNVGNGRSVLTGSQPSHGLPQSLTLTIPPMATLFLRHEVWHEESL